MPYWSRGRDGGGGFGGQGGGRCAGKLQVMTPPSLSGLTTHSAAASACNSAQHTPPARHTRNLKPTRSFTSATAAKGAAGWSYHTRHTMAMPPVDTTDVLTVAPRSVKVTLSRTCRLHTGPYALPTSGSARVRSSRPGSTHGRRKQGGDGKKQWMGVKRSCGLLADHHVMMMWMLRCPRPCSSRAAHHSPKPWSTEGGGVRGLPSLTDTPPMALAPASSTALSSAPDGTCASRSRLRPAAGLRGYTPEVGPEDRLHDAILVPVLVCVHGLHGAVPWIDEQAVPS